jgi:hypothetical protein
MNITKIERTVLLLLVIILSVIVIGCSKKQVNRETSIEENIIVEDIFVGPKWEPVEKCIAVLFGYGFEDEEVLKPLLDKIEEEYGLVDEQGLVYPLFYPEDFTVSGYIRTSKLPELIGLHNVSGLICLGSPEKIHYALAQLQDANFSGQILSLFSQDDILGTESGSDFVLDYKNDAVTTEDELAVSEETHFEYTTDVSTLLIPLLSAVHKWDTYSEKDSISFADYVIPILEESTGGKLQMYRDPETGLKAENHFVFEK